MKFGVYVALPKHNINIKYLPEIHVYSDVTPFCDSSLFDFYFYVKRARKQVTFSSTAFHEI